MNIKRDLSNLPTADPRLEERVVGHPPTRNPTIGPALANAWFKARTHDDNLARSIPDAGPFRGSDAGKCNRQLWYRLQGTEMTEPPNLADHWRMDLGSMVHEQLQGAIKSITPNAINELALDLRPAGIPGSMHLDILNPVEYGDGLYFEAVEIKTVNGFGFKSMATDFKRSGPEGPRESHIMQACIGAAAAHLGGEYKGCITGARVVYLSMELVSPQLAANIGLGGDESRFCAEWFYPIDFCLEVAAREAQRMTSVHHMHLTDEPWVEGFIPMSAYEVDNIQIVNPKTGAGVDTRGKGAKTWMCGYCSYQSQCIDDYDNVRAGAIQEMERNE